MSAIITPPTHLLNWIVVGLAIICCKVCQNIALFLLISYLRFWCNFYHIWTRACVYITPRQWNVTVSFLLLCYYLRVLLMKMDMEIVIYYQCMTSNYVEGLVLIFVEDASIEKRHYTWIRKHVNKMALVSQCQLKVIPRSHVLQDKFLSLYILNVYCFFLMK